MTKKISVLVPSFNHGSFIGKTIDSILEQHHEAEIIVMDGGSIDNTSEVVGRYGSRVIFVSEKDAGQADALNKALRRATGEWVGWQNSDDYYTAGAFDAFFAALARDGARAADVYFGHAQIVDVDGCVRFVKYYVPFNLQDLLVNGFNLTNQAMFIRRSVLERVGGWDAALGHCMDLDLFVRLAQAGSRFRLVNQILGAFRVHADAKSSRLHELRIREWDYVATKNKLPDRPQVLIRRRRQERVYWMIRRLFFLVLEGRIVPYLINRYHAVRRKDPSGHPAENYR
jgi:glycosyltransferase involved in cell wall biosynthesis